MDQDPKNFELGSVLRVIRRRGPIVLLCLILTGSASYVVSKHQRKQYTANASILFQNVQLQQQAAGLPGTAAQNPQAETDTNVRLATLPRIAVATAAAIGEGMTPGQISGAVSVAEQGDTNLATVSATAASPSLSARIANEYARQAIAYREQAERAYYANSLRAVNLEYQALTPAEKGGAQGSGLKDRAESLQILEQLQGNTVQLAQTATAPTSPSSPLTKRNTALAALLGLILGLGVVFGLERFDRKMREPGDLEAAYGLPLIGVIPESSALKAESRSSAPRRTLPDKEAEIFGLLRAHIRYFNVDRELAVIVIASAAPGDGKSTIARNLALASARVGERVLFVEADLRRPNAAKNFGVERRPGIAEILIEGLPLKTAVQRADGGQGGDHTVNVDVLVAGGILPPNPAQVLESKALESLLHQARRSYDLVIVDTPPLSLLSDAFPLIKSADGVVLVSRLGHNRRDVAARLRATLEAADAPMIGVVANGYRRRGATAYGYGYGYAYRDDADDRRVTAVAEESSNGSAPAEVIKWPNEDKSTSQS